MSVVEIENELEKMSDAERLIVIEIATKLIRKNLDNKTSPKKLSLEEAAELLRNDYLNDPELIAFTALDGEDFLIWKV